MVSLLSRYKKNWRNFLTWLTRYPNGLYILALILIFVLSAYIRLYNLGYSHFYGDETKILYLRKDTSAYDFLMNQRKGPTQFLAAWFMEKVSNSYNEFWIRLPFALAGSALVIVFYFYMLKTYGKGAALLSSALFSLNGMYIAFSRTAQYQILYLLFGVLALLFSYYINSKKSKNLFWEFLCGLFLGLSLLTHYDAIFFIIPLFYALPKRSFFRVFAFAFCLALLFYVPNILGGYFKSNTAGYILKRMEGYDYIKNNSLYTFSVYNPYFLYLIVVFVGFVLFFIFGFNEKYKSLILWFLVPFIVFQFLILNPGTHVHNYFLPVIIISSIGFVSLYKKLTGRWLKFVYAAFLSVVFLVIYGIQSWAYNPKFNNGYPWSINRPSPNYHLYLYGFPYYRGWDKVKSFLQEGKKPRNYYTNDNETVASYYLGDIPHIAPTGNFYPELYIEVLNPQQISYKLPVNKSLYREIGSFENGLIRIYKFGNQ